MQIVSLQSDPILRNDTMLKSKDSITDIYFNFYLRGGNVIFSIVNKSGKPIFYDLKNSFVAVNNLKKDLWQDVSQVSETLTLKQYRMRGTYQNPINGTISRPDRIIMIPPKSIEGCSAKMDIQTRPFNTKLYNSSQYNTTFDTVQVNWKNNSSKKTIIKTINFNKINSPATIRIFLTFCKTEDFKDPIYHDYIFWISDIMEMDHRQATKSSYPMDFYNGFYSLMDNQNKAYHPYKKAWRFYIPPYNPQ
ncbi:MAG: hypothetical protein JSU07_13495 [Bacteroidetes bacterium]|nr:hypothetical protein [Bacteroidota bacterium]